MTAISNQIYQSGIRQFHLFSNFNLPELSLRHTSKSCSSVRLRAGNIYLIVRSRVIDKDLHLNSKTAGSRRQEGKRTSFKKLWLESLLSSHLLQASLSISQFRLNTDNCLQYGAGSLDLSSSSREVTCRTLGMQTKTQYLLYDRHFSYRSLIQICLSIKKPALSQLSAFRVVCYS